MAERLLKQRIGEDANDKLVGGAEKRVRFQDLADLLRDDYRMKDNSSLDRAEVAIKALSKVFGGARALAITSLRLSRYVTTRLDQGRALATAAYELAILRSAFNVAEERGIVSRVPKFPRIVVHNTRAFFISQAEIDALVEESPYYLKPVVRFAEKTGWRKDEILGLEWRRVDWEAGVLRVEKTKNHEAREFPFLNYPPLYELLKTQRERTDEVERRTGQIVPWVFHRNGKRIKCFRGAWKGALKRAGVRPNKDENYRFRDLRRTAVRNLERAGVARSVGMKLTGHKTESVYRRYAITDELLPEGVQKLADFHASREREPRTVIPFERKAAEK